MNKQQKIEAWLIEQGYSTSGEVAPVWKDGRDIGGNTAYTARYLSSELSLPLVGIFKGTEYIKLPDFEDDVEEPKDKALVGYLIAHEYEYGCDPLGELLRAAMREINARLLALEAANEKA